MIRHIRSAVALVSVVLPLHLAAQEPVPPPPPGPPPTLNVFLDCETFWGCDDSYVRQQIPYINWMRDRQDADVHVLVTSQTTGGGGQEITLAFIGLKRFDGEADTLVHIASNTDTQGEMRDAVTRVLKLGLVRFLAKTPVAPSLDLSFTPAAAAPPPAMTAARDPWDFWTFRISASGYFNGLAGQHYASYSGSVSANRTTSASKVTLSLYGSRNRQSYTLTDSSNYVSVTESYSGNLLAVWSLGKRWSVGGTAAGVRSTYSNLDLRLSGGPAIEFDVFPYNESTRKLLTLQYSLELVSYNYHDITLDGNLSEIRPRHVLDMSTSVTQPWGQIFGSLTGTQYLHDLGVNSLEVYAGTSLRLFRGLSFNWYVDYTHINHQFGLSAAGLTDEEILLQRRQLETSYTYYLSFSLSYRFGSKFSNVVNPRMGGGGSGMIIMM
jgi:hypothetical protein